MSGRLAALLLLAYSLVRTVLRLLLGRRRGLRAFEESYAEDGCVRVTAAERAMMAGFGRCIACGLCDHGEGQRITESGGLYVGVMAFVLGGSRALGDPTAASGIARVPDEVLAEKERICPGAVPIRALVRFARQKGALAGQAVVGLPLAEHPSLSPPV